MSTDPHLRAARRPARLPWQPTPSVTTARAAGAGVCVAAAVAPAALAVRLVYTHEGVSVPSLVPSPLHAPVSAALSALTGPAGWVAFALLLLVVAWKSPTWQGGIHAAAVAVLAGGVTVPAARLLTVGSGWALVTAATVTGLLVWRYLRQRAAATRAAAPPVETARPGQVEPGQVWWAPISFEESAGSKDRPCLVLRRDGDRVYVLMFTSRDQSGRVNYVPAPTDLWRAPRESWLRTDRVITVTAADLRRLECPAGPWTQSVVELYR